MERLLDPSLAGKPVVVGGRLGQRGVVTSASYEVRALGVRTGMPLKRAYELAPHAIYLPTRHDVYGDYAARVREIAEGYTPLSQVASIDEMYLDFSGCERLYHRPDDADADLTIERVVRTLTDDIEARVGLPSSAGIATSRSVAKVACGAAKPRGVRLVRTGDEAAFLAGESVGSISNERTFMVDVRDTDTIDALLCSLCERVCWRARKRGVKARTVSLKLRYADFETLMRSRTIAATASELELYPVVRELFERARTRRIAIRLLGVCLSNLRPAQHQLSLFDFHEPLHRAIDGARTRYGYLAGSGGMGGGMPPAGGTGGPR